MENNWKKLDPKDKRTWPPLAEFTNPKNDVWLRDSDGDAEVAACYYDPELKSVNCIFTNCIESSNIFSWATHWAPATPPEFDGEDEK